MRRQAENPNDPYREFAEYCRKNRQLSTRFLKCDPRLIFVALRRYIEDPADLNALTKARDKDLRSVLRRSMRQGGPPEYRAAILELHRRADDAYDTKKWGVAHCTESLAWLERYIEVKTGRRPSSEDLCDLLDAVKAALGRNRFPASVESIQKELRRFKRRKSRWIKILEAEIQ